MATEQTEGPGGLARLRDRLGDVPAASPWLPRQFWKRIVIVVGYGLSLLFFCSLLLAQPGAWVTALAPAAEHLVTGPRPPLLVYVTTTLWFAAGQFAALIGWYRSHSENDFGGRYRLWAVLTAAFAGVSFLAGTGLHRPLAEGLLPCWRWPLWRPEVMAWFAPLAVVGVILWWRMDRDQRRCLGGLWVTRLAALTILATGCGHLFAPELSSETWYPVAVTLTTICGPGLLVLGLWLQACYVAYVCADPPEIASQTWFVRCLDVLLAIMQRAWPFGRRPVAADEPDTKPTRRRRKSEEEDTEAAPKRRRKPAAKTKRTTRSRPRVKPVEAEDEESSSEESWESEDESWEETSETSNADDAEWTEEPSSPASTRPAPVEAPASSMSAADEDEEDDGNYRADGPHASSEMFKGLSKRQRRELKKQLRDQQRTR